jgi:hypothetical protein
MDRLKRIDAKIHQGWIQINDDHEMAIGCDTWLEAWNEIKTLFVEGYAENVEDLDKKYKWSQWINNYAQDLEMELRNAGMLENPIYHSKRIDYCRELLQWCGSDELLIVNTRCAMAEAHFDSGDEVGCDRLFEGWLQDDPDWDLGYLAWSECYQSKDDGSGNEKAEEILLAGYARRKVRENIELVSRLMALYEDTGKPEKFKEFEAVFNELLSKIPQSEDDKELRKALLEMQRSKPADVIYDKPSPVRVVKIGRNEPCPCGSGKKYKKCCGA